MSSLSLAENGCLGLVESIGEFNWGSPEEDRESRAISREPKSGGVFPPERGVVPKQTPNWMNPREPNSTKTDFCHSPMLLGQLLGLWTREKVVVGGGAEQSIAERRGITRLVQMVATRCQNACKATCKRRFVQWLIIAAGTAAKMTSVGDEGK